MFRFYRDPQKRNNWGVLGSEVGGRTAAELYSAVGTCKHLAINPFTDLRDAVPGVFALGEKPTTEQLPDWLPDRWQLNRTRVQLATDATTRSTPAPPTRFKLAGP